MQNLSTAIDWDDLRFFSAVSEYGTISAAAKKLHVNHVTVSRHINKLEEALGIRLFDRLNDGYRLTTDGKAIYKRVQSVRSHIDDILLLNPKYLSLTGTVVVSGTRNLIDCFLSKEMKKFYENYPEINIVFITENRNLSIVKRETDISLRINRPKEGCFKIRKLVSMNYFLYANNALTQKYQKEGLYNLRYINFTDDLYKLEEYIWLRDHFPRQNLCMQSNSQYSHMQAIKSGVGVGILPKFTVSSEDLHRIEHPLLPISKELWMLVRPDISVIPAVRTVMDYFIKLFSENKGNFI